MIPKNIDEVTNDWLSEVLSVPVAGQSRTQIGQGVGLLGDIYRVLLDLGESPPPTAPQSVVVKLPSSIPENRQQAVALGMFEAEVRFYNEVATRAKQGLPDIFHAAVAPGGEDFVIVMQDLTHLQMVNQSDGMTALQAEAAVKALASLHARWWGEADSDNYEWIPTMIGPRIEFIDDYLTQVFPNFVANFEHELPPGGLEIYQAFVGNYQKINQQIAARSPWTIAHQDARVENMLFGADGSEQVVVIDWQGLGRGPGVYDLGYTLGGSMEPEIRRANEANLLRAYHQRLVDEGIKDYSPEQLQEDYAHTHLMGGLATSILTGGAMDLSNERGRQLISTMIRRHVIAAIDHGGAARLAQLS